MYTVRQLDSDDRVLSEVKVEGTSYNAVLRDIRGLAEGTRRIEVFSSHGEKAGEIGADYWRQRVRRR